MTSYYEAIAVEHELKEDSNVILTNFEEKQRGAVEDILHGVETERPILVA